VVCGGQRFSEWLRKTLDAQHIVPSIVCPFTLAASLVIGILGSMR
jgi:hypothetical protein